MAERFPIREYLKFKYAAPAECCKCGNCQLVPPEVIRDAADEIDVMHVGLGKLQGLFNVVAAQRDEAMALVHQIRAMTLSEASAYARLMGKAHLIKDAEGPISPMAVAVAKNTAKRISDGIMTIPGATPPASTSQPAHSATRAESR